VSHPPLDRPRLFGEPRTWLTLASLQVAFFALMTRPLAWHTYRHELFVNGCSAAMIAMVVGGFLAVGNAFATLAGWRGPFRVTCRAIARHRGVLGVLLWTLPALDLLAAVFFDLLDNHFGSAHWPWTVRLCDAAPAFAAVPTVAIVTRIVVLGLVSLGARPDDETEQARARRRELATTQRTFHAGPTSAAQAAGALVATVCAFACATAWLSALAHHLSYESLVFIAVTLAAVPNVLLAALRRASRIDVGLEGVRVRHPFGSQLLDYRDLHDVKQDGALVSISRRGAAPIMLSFHGKDEAHGPIVCDRIDRAVRASNAVSAEAMRSAELAQEARTADAHAPEYRASTIPAEQLWSLVEGPGVTTRARVAAAEVLASQPGSRDAQRLQSAMDQCLDEQSRAALGKAVDRSWE
jgi:hypothetical protein